MSSEKFKDIMASFPLDKESIRRLEELVSHAGAPAEPAYSFDHLIDVLAPSSPEALSLLLTELQQRGFVEKIVRVESPSNKGGIGDFRSVADVPEEIYDWRTDRTIAVEPDNLKVLFKIHRV